jgi:hypothetical protein
MQAPASAIPLSLQLLPLKPMSTEVNSGYDAQEIENFKKELDGKIFLLNDDEPNNEQVMHFYFLGNHKGQPAVFDAVAYTLLLAYDSKVYETAEQEAQQQFPTFTPGTVDEETGEEIEAKGLTEEVEEFIADRMLALEEEDEIRVSESLVIDDEFGGGVGLEVALNRPDITPEVIEEFILAFNAGKLELDKTLYSYPGEEDDEDEENA